jgi:hypothetical protein
MHCSSLIGRLAALFAAATLCALAVAARSETTADARPPSALPRSEKPALPADVSSCASAVDRIVAGHPRYSRFVWDRDDPRKYIHSTVMPSTEFRGKMVPVDYTLILVGQLRQRGNGTMVDGNGVCGMRAGHIVSVRVEPSPPKT